MLCPSCGQETEKGKFCTNCGALLADEPAASAEPEENKEQEIHHEQAHSGASQKKENDFTATVKKESANFGAFFMRLIKAPSKAKNITGHELVPWCYYNGFIFRLDCFRYLFGDDANW
ncbi:hypothetical protein PD280_02405 [Virgibacillus salarius]|uniref:hypothetical protein n=1 Tax=Virgibacillus salarius TaxID=447199 RepID=UPI002490D7AC|nr:hypothetical protein [Virgibacillus salarius]WBX80703.1 hypothetical protein PD280_02405 [Virgibacillus salarius]